jgi:hypothetical protein
VTAPGRRFHGRIIPGNPLLAAFAFDWLAPMFMIESSFERVKTLNQHTNEKD